MVSYLDMNSKLEKSICLFFTEAPLLILIQKSICLFFLEANISQNRIDHTEDNKTVVIMIRILFI